MFKDLVKLHLWLEQALREALACRPGHENNMKTSLSAALFSLPETTNRGGKKRETRKERVSAPLGRHLLPVQMRRQVKKDYLAPEIELRFPLFSVLSLSLLSITIFGFHSGVTMIQINDSLELWILRSQFHSIFNLNIFKKNFGPYSCQLNYICKFFSIELCSVIFKVFCWHQTHILTFSFVNLLEISDTYTLQLPA